MMKLNRYIRRMLLGFLLTVLLLPVCAVGLGPKECIRFQKNVIASPVFWEIGCISAAMAFLGYAITQRETIDNMAGAYTIKFVRSALREAGYSADQINKVKILSGKPFCSTRNCIYVPFNDDQLLRARKYYHTGLDQEGKEIAGVYLRKMREVKLYDDLSDDDLLNILQFEGKAITKDTIPFWKGAITHEMGHIVHNHTAKSIFFLGTVGSLITAYSVALMHQNTTIQKWLNQLGRIEAAYVAPASIVLGAVLFFSGPLWRSHEIQADDEMIHRAKDPKVLLATEKMFQSIGKLHHLKDKWKRFIVNCLHYFDPHPRGDERARRIRQAYENMMKK